MQELTLLHTKLDKLLKKYAALQAEKDDLLATLRRQNEDMQQLNKKVASLEEELNLAKTGDAIAGKDDKTAVRKQLNSLIGDIDKLLASLND
jgi:chromosome segregation ATPase